MNEKLDYDEINRVYEMNWCTCYEKEEKKKRARIQKTLKNMYARKFGEREWESLKPLEKEYFIYVYIQETMLKNMNSAQASRIKKKIEDTIGDTFFSYDIITRRNEALDKIYKDDYIQPQDSDKKKASQYKVFKNDLKKLNSFITPPTFQEWKKNPLRPYDYIQTFLHEGEGEYPKYLSTDDEVLRIIVDYFEKYHNMNTSQIKECLNLSFYQSEEGQRHPRYLSVTSVIIQIIMQYLEKYHGLKINVPLIEECLCFLESVDDLDDFDKMETKFVDGEESMHDKWIKYNKMREELIPFYECTKQTSSWRK